MSNISLGSASTTNLAGIAPIRLPLGDDLRWIAYMVVHDRFSAAQTYHREQN